MQVELNPLNEHKPIKPFFDYHGIKIFGLNERPENPLISPSAVTQLLDRFPPGYWAQAVLADIQYEDYEIYSALRLRPNETEEIVFAVEPVDEPLLPYISAQTKGKVVVLKKNDTILARKRGMNVVNDDNTITIVMFSTQNWDGKGDPQLDAENVLFGTAHELGHHTWMRLFSILKPRTPDGLGRQDLLPFASLPANQLPRYLAYKPIFEREMQNPENYQTDKWALRLQEDFAIAHEYYFYWQNLQELDPARHEALAKLYSKY